MNESQLHRITRDAMLLMVRHEVPDIAEVRWSCRRPTVKPTYWDQMMESFGTLTLPGYEDILREDTVEEVASTNAPGMDNVNIITDRVPPHIAALPEEEQGPALVEAIFERKRRGQS